MANYDWEEERILNQQIALATSQWDEPKYAPDGRETARIDLEKYKNRENIQFSPTSDQFQVAKREQKSFNLEDPKEQLKAVNAKVNRSNVPVENTRFENFHKFKNAIKNSGTSKKEPDMPKPEPESKAKQIVKGADNLGSALAADPRKDSKAVSALKIGKGIAEIAMALKGLKGDSGSSGDVSKPETTDIPFVENLGLNDLDKDKYFKGIA